MPPQTDSPDDARLPNRPGIEILCDVATKIGQLSLRRRFSRAAEQDLYEMLLNGQLVMSSAVTDSERALADAALTVLPQKPLRLLIGGLGFGFTALAALEDPRVRDVTVVEQLEPVIEWHTNALLPWATPLTADARVRLLHDDFFALVPRLAASPERYDAILVDIDDSPCAMWSPDHSPFYSEAGLANVRALLEPDGVFALWFASRPERGFLKAARSVFPDAQISDVRFVNPSFNREESNFILLGTRDGAQC